MMNSEKSNNIYSEYSTFFNASARLPSSSPSSVIYNIISVGMVIDVNTGLIEDATITLLSNGAKRFLNSLIVGYNLKENSIEPLINKIRIRYQGESQNAICISLERVYRKYVKFTEKDII